MSKSYSSIARLGTLFSVLFLYTLFCSVYAHMNVNPKAVEAGSHSTITMRIGHDCGDETVGTTNFTVLLPKYMPGVTVEQMANWRVFIHKETGTVGDREQFYKHLVALGRSTSHSHDSAHSAHILKKNDEMEMPTASHNNMQPVEYVRAVTYIGFLPDNFYQLFNIRIKMPSLPGAKLWISGYQDCHNQGTSIAWATIPSSTTPHPKYPARSITLLMPSNKPHMH